MPGVRRTWVRNIVPNLPAPIRPMRIGRPAASRSEKLGEQIHQAALSPSASSCRRVRRDASRRHGLRASFETPTSCALRVREYSSSTIAREIRIRDRCLLARRLGHHRFDFALATVAVQHAADRTFAAGRDIGALAGRKSLAAAERFGRGLAVGRTIGRDLANLTAFHHPRVRQILESVGGFARRRGGILRRLLVLGVQLAPFGVLLLDALLEIRRRLVPPAVQLGSKKLSLRGASGAGGGASAPLAAGPAAAEPAA